MQTALMASISRSIIIFGRRAVILLNGGDRVGFGSFVVLLDDLKAPGGLIHGLEVGIGVF
jgi:hypothetical protein